MKLNAHEIATLREALDKLSTPEARTLQELLTLQRDVWVVRPQLIEMIKLGFAELSAKHAEMVKSTRLFIDTVQSRCTHDYTAPRFVRGVIRKRSNSCWVCGKERT